MLWLGPGLKRVRERDSGPATSIVRLRWGIPLKSDVVAILTSLSLEFPWPLALGGFVERASKSWVLSGRGFSAQGWDEQKRKPNPDWLGAQSDQQALGNVLWVHAHVAGLGGSWTSDIFGEQRRPKTF